MNSGILSFRQIVGDLAINIWHLRQILLLILVGLGISTILFISFESIAWPNAILLTLGDLFGNSFFQYFTTTTIGSILRVYNSFTGYLLLGIVVWVVQESISDHPLKKSRNIFFSTEKDY